MADWRDCKLGDLLHIKHGFAFLGEHFVNEGTHIVLTPGNFLEEGGFKEKIDKAKWYNGPIPSDYVLNEGDVIVAMTEQAEGLLGSSAIIPRSSIYLHNQRLGLVQIRDPEQADQHFIYYLFNSKSVRQQIRGSASGAKIRHTAPSRIADVKVSLPPVTMQRRIAAILSAYDETIENNTRRIQILEQMAQTLYREWFVNFRFPCHAKVKLVDSPMGKIPQGWEVVRVEDIYRTASGRTPSRKVPEYYGGTINWVKTQELQDCFIFDTDEKISALGLENSSTKVFPANTVLIAMYGATIGKLGILAQPAATNQACCALLPKLPNFGHAFAFLTLLVRRIDLINLRQGAAQQNVSQIVIRGFTVLKPVEEIVRLFNSVAEPMLDLIRNLQCKKQVLIRTRDLLLPKLISGALSVENMEVG